MFKKKNDLDELLQSKMDKEKDIDKQINIIQMDINNSVKEEYLKELQDKRDNLQTTINSIREDHPNLDLLNKKKIDHITKS